MRAISIRAATAGLVFALAGFGSAAAQECKPDEIFAVIDGAGQRLRDINSEWQPRLRDKLRELAQKNGWSDAQVESMGRSAFEDDQTRAMDLRAGELLAQLNELGDDDRAKQPVCTRLEQARTKSTQLIEVTSARSAHAIARLDAALRPATPPAQAPAAVAANTPTAAAEPPRQAAPPPRQKSPPPVASWDTRTLRDSQPPSPPPAVEVPPPPLDPAELGYSPEEIRAAGRGFFGTISAGLASVIDHAFQRYGRPTGYILGDEGGGAFLAGLRYGDGRLVTKTQGERKVYWQGPSAGFDFGAAGSQVMFLVYGVEDHAQLFQRFTGVDGSAYLVGGVGITYLRRGNVILAPIRTGIGLRLGASIGYIKFTPTASLNPF